MNLPFRDSKSFQDAALELIDRGYLVVPCHSTTGKPCRKPEEATDDRAQIADWNRKRKDFGVAILTGERGRVTGIDIDKKRRHDKEGNLLDIPSGFDTAKALAGRGIHFPKAPRVRTPSGGIHIWAKFTPDLIGGPGRLGPGIDIRNITEDGGDETIIAPPTRRIRHLEDGSFDLVYYEWLTAPMPYVDELPDIDPGIVQEFRRIYGEQEDARRLKEEERTKAAAFYSNRVTTTINGMTAAQRKRLDAYTAKMFSDIMTEAKLASGTTLEREQLVNRLTCKLGKWKNGGFFTEKQITDGMLEACKDNELNKHKPGAARRTIARALKASAHLMPSIEDLDRHK